MFSRFFKQNKTPPNIKEMQRNDNVNGLTKAFLNYKEDEIGQSALLVLSHLTQPGATFLDTQESAINALKKIGNKAIGPLLMVLETGDHNKQFNAIEALGRIGIADKRVIEALRVFLKSGETLRKSAIRALMRIGGRDAGAVLQPYYDEAGITPDGAVAMLVDLYDGRYQNDKKITQREIIRDIGERLHELGGFGMMQQVHSLFAQKRPQNASTLETMWDGIGMWQK